MRDTAVRLRLPHKKILLSRHGSSRRNTNPAFSPHQPVGQNVRGYLLLRPGQQLAEVTAVAEHQVADDDQAPTRPSASRVRLIWQPELGGVHAHSKNQ